MLSSLLAILAPGAIHPLMKVSGCLGSLAGRVSATSLLPSQAPIIVVLRVPRISEFLIPLISTSPTQMSRRSRPSISRLHNRSICSLIFRRMRKAAFVPIPRWVLTKSVEIPVRVTVSSHMASNQVVSGRQDPSIIVPDRK